jgi:MmyB-like transcription regulator ligand binding domain
VGQHLTGIKQLRHPAVGELNLNYEAMPLPADAGLTLTAFSAPAGSADDDALHQLGSHPPRRGL